MTVARIAISLDAELGRDDCLFTSDPDDMARLLDALRKRPTVVPC